MYVVKHGVIVAQELDVTSDHADTYQYGVGDYLGIKEVIEEGKYDFTAISVGPVEVVALHRSVRTLEISRDLLFNYLSSTLENSCL